jgi:hypothetical protein
MRSTTEIQCTHTIDGVLFFLGVVSVSVRVSPSEKNRCWGASAGVVEECLGHEKSHFYMFAAKEIGSQLDSNVEDDDVGWAYGGVFSSTATKSMIRW